MEILCTLITNNKAEKIDTYSNETFRLSFTNHYTAQQKNFFFYLPKIFQRF